jgi:hypothetical protein
VRTNAAGEQRGATASQESSTRQDKAGRRGSITFAINSIIQVEFFQTNEISLAQLSIGNDSACMTITQLTWLSFNRTLRARPPNRAGNKP